MYATELPGLTVGPMGAWLAAVGMLRVLHRADPDATLQWDGPMPEIRTAVPAAEREIADQMVFSPVVTPWQSGGGWGAKDKTPAARLHTLRTSTSPRLAALQEAVLAADQVMGRVGGRDKRWMVRELRNWLPEAALPWLDVAVPLHDAADEAGQRVGWAPLAGTGGNDGRWDLSTTFHAAVAAVSPDRLPGPHGATDDPEIIRRRNWLADLIESTEFEPLVEMSGGPYWPRPDPPAVGDFNPLLNPWAMILTVEGLLTFGDHPVREVHDRHQPWTTETLDEPASPDEPGWGEAWLPLWSDPMTLPEVWLLLGGPWPRWRSRRATRPAQMYAAFHAGGFPRGVTGVARFGLARRRGRAHMAVPLDHLIGELPPVEWLSTAQAATRAGVAESTWIGYVSRGQAPAHDRRNPDTGAREWWPGTVDSWIATRPGPGVRTDLN